MDQFSHLSVLLSLIIGLAITQVLKGFRMHGQDLAFGLIDLLFATLFAAAYAMTGPKANLP